jgi:hypothetical protein
MLAPDDNLTFLQVMLEEFEAYLLSDELYWPLDSSSLKRPSPPRLTPGRLALTLDELDAQGEEMTPAQRAECRKLNLQAESILRKWSAALGRKAAREMHSRLNLWKAYIHDLVEDAERADNYTYEVQQRVIFERITAWAEHEPEAEQNIQAIHSVDATLRSLFKPGDFIWDARLRSCYPQERYWFLYGVPVLNR